MMLTLSLILCILKTFWTSSNRPSYVIDSDPIQTVALAVSLVVEVLVLVQLWLILATGVSVNEQRQAAIFT